VEALEAIAFGNSQQWEPWSFKSHFLQPKIIFKEDEIMQLSEGQTNTKMAFLINLLSAHTACKTRVYDRSTSGLGRTRNVPCDCLKVGLDFVSTDFQAVAWHFAHLERMA